jgi:hypothetical protein
MRALERTGEHPPSGREREEGKRRRRALEQRVRELERAAEKAEREAERAEAAAGAARRVADETGPRRRTRPHSSASSSSRAEPGSDVRLLPPGEGRHVERRHDAHTTHDHQRRVDVALPPDDEICEQRADRARAFPHVLARLLTEPEAQRQRGVRGRNERPPRIGERRTRAGLGAVDARRAHHLERSFLERRRSQAADEIDLTAADLPPASELLQKPAWARDRGLGRGTSTRLPRAGREALADVGGAKDEHASRGGRSISARRGCRADRNRQARESKQPAAS